MPRTNTKNINNKLSVFKAQLVLRKTLVLVLGAKTDGLIMPRTVWQNYIFYTVSIPRNDLDNYVLSPSNS